MRLLAVLAALFLAPLARAEVKIVAAENFYGGVAKQIAGDAAEVTAILSNPNQDPHEFTSDAKTAKAVADADIVIYNGLGYDGWMDKLLGTAGKPHRVVVRVADLIGAQAGANPHIWYDPRTMPALADKIYATMSEIDVGKESMFFGRAEMFKSSMKDLTDEIDAIKSKYGNTPVTATEPVFGDMALALGFQMLNVEFQFSIMNDTEPSAAQTADFEKSLRPKTVKLLFYNSQVTDPTTERLKKLAIAADIPIIGVTETQPAGAKNYVDWMMSELHAVEDALGRHPGSFPGSKTSMPDSAAAPVSP